MADAGAQALRNQPRETPVGQASRPVHLLSLVGHAGYPLGPLPIRAQLGRFLLLSADSALSNLDFLNGVLRLFLRASESPRQASSRKPVMHPLTQSGTSPSP